MHWLIYRYGSISVTSTEPARDAVTASAADPATRAAPQQVASRAISLGWSPGTMAINYVKVEPFLTDPSLKKETTIVRDACGNITTVNTQADDGTGPTTRATQIAWDTLDQTLPHKVINPAQQVQTLYYHAGLSLLAVVDDVNGLRTVTKFDQFGRRRTIDAPSSADLSVDYGLAQGDLLEVTTTAASGNVSRRFLNKWGFAARIELSQFNGALAVVEKTFTRSNRLATETVPHYDPAPSRLGPDPMRLAAAYVRFTYDNLGRVRRREVFDRVSPFRDPAPVHTEAWSYDGLIQRHTNARGIDSTIKLDSAARLVRTATLEPPATRAGLELPRTHQVISRYEYGPFDVLDAVIDPAGNRLEFQYDVWGRQIAATDPSSGRSTVAYNGYGEVKQTTNGAGLQTSIIRDPLGRVLKQTHSDLARGTTLTDSFVWDVAVNGIGKLAQATSADGIQTAYSYDTLSRPTRKEWTVSGESFALESTWDAFDRPLYLKYPAVGSKQLVIEYEYELSRRAISGAQPSHSGAVLDAASAGRDGRAT